MYARVGCFAGPKSFGRRKAFEFRIRRGLAHRADSSLHRAPLTRAKATPRAPPPRAATIRSLNSEARKPETTIVVGPLRWLPRLGAESAPHCRRISRPTLVTVKKRRRS